MRPSGVNASAVGRATVATCWSAKPAGTVRARRRARPSPRGEHEARQALHGGRRTTRVSIAGRAANQVAGTSAAALDRTRVRIGGPGSGPRRGRDRIRRRRHRAGSGSGVGGRGLGGCSARREAGPGGRAQARRAASAPGSAAAWARARCTGPGTGRRARGRAPAPRAAWARWAARASSSCSGTPARAGNRQLPAANCSSAALPPRGIGSPCATSSASKSCASSRRNDSRRPSFTASGSSPMYSSGTKPSPLSG